MNNPPPKDPTKTFTYRLAALFSRVRLHNIYRSANNIHVFSLCFVFVAGAAAIGTIAAIARLIHLPLLFPPLAPSAFIIFYTPLSPSASPRTVIFAHSMSLFAGLGAVYACRWFGWLENLGALAPMTWGEVAAITFAMALASALMVALRIPHPPATASAMLAVLGAVTINEPLKVAGFLLAVILLAFEGVLFNRVIAGLPYPLWRHNPKIVRRYPELASLANDPKTHWEKLSRKLFR